MINGTLGSKIKKILLPIRGGPSAAFSLRVAIALAQTFGAQIAILHAMPNDKLGEQRYERFLSHLQNLPEVTRWIDAHGDPARAILRVARVLKPQLIILGAIARSQPGDPPIGPTATRVADEADAVTLIVRARPESVIHPSPVDYTISVVVDKWFAENTFHAHEFKNIKRLVEMKERQGLSISLGLPALDEEKTIGKVIKTVRTTFMQRYPLLDEIVVIDSNSTDRTVAIAQDLGVPVYRHSEILPQHGSFVGKGEALWKSLYVLKGDLIAWIDTDIINIHPRFVYGILGPLVKEPRLMYVKGFYQRPLRLNGKTEARGGGRVTELMARPLFNLFYPELSGLVQPLAGEYAGRRKALERVPFFTGYGVETGLLIDLLNRFGLRAIGQVDLEERVHRNQSLFALSKMAYAILQVVMQRVGFSHHVELLNALNASMKLIHYSEEEFRLQVAEIRDRERPPMISISDYRAWRHPSSRT
jgi:glucosyl-3-phosphoglycerate synthase